MSLYVEWITATCISSVILSIAAASTARIHKYIIKKKAASKKSRCQWLYVCVHLRMWVTHSTTLYNTLQQSTTVYNTLQQSTTPTNSNTHSATDILIHITPNQYTVHQRTIASIRKQVLIKALKPLKFVMVDFATQIRNAIKHLALQKRNAGRYEIQQVPKSALTGNM